MEEDQALRNVNSILDGRFYEKVAVLADNARLITEKKSSLDIDIYGIHANAVECFFQKQYPATVFYASIGVERYLNKTLRKKWICLNFELIKKAYEAGIVAVTELLNESEKVVLKKVKKKPYPIFCFCGRRNKILHGDTEGLVKIKGPEIELIDTRTIYAGTGEKKAYTFMINSLESAYDQLLKFQKFLLKI
jgi:hypothetical protein